MPDRDARDVAVERLYAVRPDEFLPLRSSLVAAARAEGDRALARQIGALRKPGLAAWAVNHLVRTRPELVDRVGDLAARLRVAYGSRDGPLIQVLGRERATVVEDFAAAAAQAAAEVGVDLKPAALGEVRATVVAALADRDDLAAMTEATLTRPLSYVGFGDVDPTESTAPQLRLVPRGDADDTVEPGSTQRLPGDGSTQQPADGTWQPADGTRQPPDDAEPQLQAQHERDLKAAHERLQAAITEATAVTSRLGVLRAELELADTRVGQLQRELAKARAHRDATADALAAADVADERAQVALRAAHEALEALGTD